MLVGAFVSEFIDLGVKCVFFSRERSQSVRFLCICLADLNEIGYKNMVHHTHIYIYIYSQPTISISGTDSYDDGGDHFPINKMPVIGALCFGSFFFNGKGGGV